MSHPVDLPERPEMLEDRQSTSEVHAAFNALAVLREQPTVARVRERELVFGADGVQRGDAALEVIGRA